MGKQDHIIRSLSLHFVDIALNAGIKRLPGFIGLEIIHGDSLVIDHFMDLGFTVCIRSVHTDKSDAGIPAFQYPVGIINSLPVRSAEVRTDVAAFQLFSQFIQHVKAEIKLVIPKDGDIVSRLIHDADELFSFRE